MTTHPDQPRKLLPMLVTAKLADTKAFYVDQLGWTATYDKPYYLQVRADQPDGPELAFMVPDGPSALGPSFAGDGLVVSVPVADADRHHATMRERGLEPLSEPSRKPWGWRSYYVRDPNGLILDFFHAEGPAMPSDN